MKEDKKKILFDKAIPKREKETDVLLNTSESYEDSNIENNNNKSFVYSILQKKGAVGEKNGINAKQLVSIAGFSNERMLREAVAFERKNCVICSSTSGYYLPDMDDAGIPTDIGIAEIGRFYRSTKARAISSLTAAKTAKIALEEAEIRKTMAEQHYFLKGEGTRQWVKDTTG